MQFKELTTWQREPLFHLVALQQKEQRQITFSFWDGSSEVSYYPSNEKASHMAAEAGLETIGLWEKEGYVHTKTIVQKGPQTISTYILQERSERGRSSCCSRRSTMPPLCRSHDGKEASSDLGTGWRQTYRLFYGALLGRSLCSLSHRSRNGFRPCFRSHIYFLHGLKRRSAFSLSSAVERKSHRPPCPGSSGTSIGVSHWRKQP